MKRFDAMMKAAETGQVQITRKSAKVLTSIALLNDAAESVTDAIIANIPEEAADDERVNGFTDRFIELYTPLVDFLCSEFGRTLGENMLMDGAESEFNGL